MDRAYDASLDEALEQTFPASDPISMQQPVVVGGRDSPPENEMVNRPRPPRPGVKRRAPRRRKKS
jgi:hypothetical protein